MNTLLSQKQETTQSFYLLPQMRQRLALLQLPLNQLSVTLENEMQMNPIFCDEDEGGYGEEEEQQQEKEHEMEELSFDERDFSRLEAMDFDSGGMEEGKSPFSLQEWRERQSFCESLLTRQESLFERIMMELREFCTKRELFLAEYIVGELDEKGMLSLSLDDIAIFHDLSLEELKPVLKKIQQLHPGGIGSRSIREALLIQLELQGKQETMAYCIVRNYYSLLLKRSFLKLAKALRCSVDQLQLEISLHLASLSFSPGSMHASCLPSAVTVDMIFYHNNGSWNVKVNDEHLPTFRINLRYCRMLREKDSSSLTKSYLKQKLNAGRTLLNNIDERNNLLLKIGQFILQQQADFFVAGVIRPLQMQQLARHLDVSESTVTRAIMEKYASTPFGITPLRKFFTGGYTSRDGKQIAPMQIQEKIKMLIETENPIHPISDQMISTQLQKEGIDCARRTIAKYRESLKIGNRSQRREEYHLKKEKTELYTASS